MYYYSNELYHYGVKGMKWGVRRYQNKDGTLTTAGKIRANRLKKAIAANERDVADLKKSMATTKKQPLLKLLEIRIERGLLKYRNSNIRGFPSRT